MLWELGRLLVKLLSKLRWLGWLTKLLRKLSCLRSQGWVSLRQLGRVRELLLLWQLCLLLLGKLAKEWLGGLSWKLLESLLARCWEGGRLLRKLLRRFSLGRQLLRGKCMPRELLLSLAKELLLCLPRELLLLGNCLHLLRSK